VWLLVSALSVMNIAITLGTVLGDRLLYWPSVAWCGLLAAFAAFLLNPARDRGAGALRLAARDPRRPVRPPRAGIAFAVLLVALSMAYAARAAVYVPAWRNDRTLFETSVRAEPRAPRAWYNLGRSYQDEGRIDDAIRSFENAVDYSPDYEESWAQLAIGLMQAGRWEESRAPLAESLRLNPKDIVSIMNEGVLWLNTGREEDARARFLDITRKEPDRADAWHNLALADQRLGDDGGAAEAWRRVIELRPKDGAALNNLAWLLATRLADPVQAESLARRAVSMDGANAEWLDTLAEALFRQGKRDEAVRVEESALRLADAPAYREQLRRFREDPIPPAR
jgi:tetratricopeptide (TPR) repeat protein